MRIAQVLWGKAHYIFEALEMPSWPPDPEGNPTVLVDITSYPDVIEGWDYNAGTGKFTMQAAAGQSSTQQTEA